MKIHTLRFSSMVNSLDLWRKSKSASKCAKIVMTYFHKSAITFFNIHLERSSFHESDQQTVYKVSAMNKTSQNALLVILFLFAYDARATRYSSSNCLLVCLQLIYSIYNIELLKCCQPIYLMAHLQYLKLLQPP